MQASSLLKPSYLCLIQKCFVTLQLKSNRIHAPNHYALHIQGAARTNAQDNCLYRGEAPLWNEDISTDLDLSNNHIVEHKEQSVVIYFNGKVN